MSEHSRLLLVVIETQKNTEASQARRHLGRVVVHIWIERQASSNKGTSSCVRRIVIALRAVKLSDTCGTMNR